MNKKEKEYCDEILKKIENKEISTSEELHKQKIKLAKKYELKTLPSNPDILSQAKNKEHLNKFLGKKPIRGLSGVSVIAVMTPPKGCVGKCIYCPESQTGQATPKSYTGLEPSTMRAAMFNYDPKKIIENRIESLETTGHEPSKIELILQGGTITSWNIKEQQEYVKKCLDAITEKESKDIEEAKINAMKSKKRVIGITFETRPDWCKQKEINEMLDMGVTRVELGVQLPDDEVYKIIKRGHTTKDVIESTAMQKDSALKILYHLMTGLPGSDYKNDLKKMKEIFENPDYRPDMIKIYPCLVMKGTELYEMWKRGEYKPMETEKAAKLIAELKTTIPKYVRIMRIQRDIPTTIIQGGVKKSNLRELVQKEMKEKNIKCQCIRCREAGIKTKQQHEIINYENIKLETIKYEASKGIEEFLSYEEKKSDALIGFARLRIPNPEGIFRKEITEKTALIRELHVYDEAVPIGKKSEKEMQHKGYGKKLVEEAEIIAKEKYGMDKMIIIAGLGVREYYIKKLGYKIEGAYGSKNL